MSREVVDISGVNYWVEDPDLLHTDSRALIRVPVINATEVLWLCSLDFRIATWTETEGFEDWVVFAVLLLGLVFASRLRL